MFGSFLDNPDIIWDHQKFICESFRNFEKSQKIDPDITPRFTHVNTYFTDFDDWIMFVDAVLNFLAGTCLNFSMFNIVFAEIKIC